MSKRLYTANTVDGEQRLINPVLFQTLHPGIGGA
jgi:hypothetical protein